MLRRCLPVVGLLACAVAADAPPGTQVARAPALAPRSKAAADWPQWQGPRRDNVSAETGLLQSWPDDGPKLAWKVSSVGLGYSGPAVVGDRLYTQGATEDDNKEFVVCLDAATGKTVWQTTIVNKFYTNNWGGGPRGTPTVDGDRVYVIGPMGDVACLKAADGEVVWHVNMVKDLRGKLMSGWGYSESPLIDGDLLICSPGGEMGRPADPDKGKAAIPDRQTLAALDKLTGKVKWRSDGLTDAAAYSSAVVAEVNGVKMYVQQTDKGLVGVAAATGKLLWSVEGDGYKTAVIPTPIVRGNEVYATSDYGAGCMYVTLAADGSTGVAATKVYANKKFQSHHGGIALVGDHVYGWHGNSGGRGGWVCQKVQTGEVVWTEEKAQEAGSLTVADGRMYTFGQSKGEAVLAEVTLKGWKEHGRLKLPELTKFRKPAGRIWTHPVVANGRLYLRDQELLYCYDVRK